MRKITVRLAKLLHYSIRCCRRSNNRLTISERFSQQECDHRTLAFTMSGIQEQSGGVIIYRARDPGASPSSQLETPVKGVSRRHKGFWITLQLLTLQQRKPGQIFCTLKGRRWQAEPIHCLSIIGHSTISVRHHALHSPSLDTLNSIKRPKRKPSLTTNMAGQIG